MFKFFIVFFSIWFSILEGFIGDTLLSFSVSPALGGITLLLMDILLKKENKDIEKKITFAIIFLTFLGGAGMLVYANRMLKQCDMSMCKNEHMSNSRYCNEHYNRIYQGSIIRKRETVTKKNNDALTHKLPSRSKYYDPYDVLDYDNGDDFADEWADEFDDMDYDEGYDEAYDYWEENR